MPRQSHLFRTVLLISGLSIMASGAAFSFWQWNKHRTRTFYRQGGTQFERSVPWSDEDRMWSRVGWIQLAAGAVICGYLLITRNPYRYVTASSKRLMEFSDDEPDGHDEEAKERGQSSDS